jgi:hypothetical protein
MNKLIDMAYEAGKSKIFVNNDTKQMVIQIKWDGLPGARYLMIDKDKNIIEINLNDAEIYIDNPRFEEYKIEEFLYKSLLLDYLNH